MKSEILLGEREDRNAGEIDLLPAGELEQEIERTFESVEIDGERGVVGRPRSESKSLGPVLQTRITSLRIMRLSGAAKR